MRDVPQELAEKTRMNSIIGLTASTNRIATGSMPAPVGPWTAARFVDEDTSPSSRPLSAAVWAAESD